ncbi:diacylglycerol/lipid kinase family protein [Cellulomonas edaphi]|uniref:Diacylglycerol kinase family protein n=1 Tax=Cellulomonas edaphi TaxID=3053468 RepID=A0ABT7S2U6_9CELL|nr:diacylglycerol kinase family protein [Cellulomons edaphi]MDM7829936.1 diacylglycerol kinase family protein [Cellulomons edaphi]
MTEPASAQRHGSGPLRSAVVVNANRVERAAELRDEITEQLAAAGWPAPAWFETTAEDPGRGQAEQAVADGAEVVFVCGGDGTVRSAIEGLVGTDAALAVLPGGTGNLLATNLDVPTNVPDGVDTVLERGRRAIDVGDVEGQSFAVMAGMGLDAAMVDDAPTALKARAGSVAYVFSALRHAFDDEMRVEVTVDGKPPVRRHARTVLVGNVGRLQGGVNVLPDAEADSGAMDVAIVAPRNLAHWFEILFGVLRGRRRLPRVEYLRGKHVVVRATEPQPRQLDGDVIEPGTTLEVTVRPASLWVCVHQPDSADDLAEGGPHSR